MNIAPVKLLASLILNPDLINLPVNYVPNTGEMSPFSQMFVGKKKNGYISVDVEIIWRWLINKVDF